MIRVFVEHVVGFVADTRSSHLHEHVEESVAVPVGKRNGVPLLQMSGARTRGDIRESRAGDVFEHSIRHQCSQIGVAGTEVHIQKTVVVDVAKVAAHRGENQIQSGIGSHVGKRIALFVVIQTIRGT